MIMIMIMIMIIIIIIIIIILYFQKVTYRNVHNSKHLKTWPSSISYLI